MLGFKTYLYLPFRSLDSHSHTMICGGPEAHKLPRSCLDIAYSQIHSVESPVFSSPHPQSLFLSFGVLNCSSHCYYCLCPDVISAL